MPQFDRGGGQYGGERNGRLVRSDDDGPHEVDGEDDDVGDDDFDDGPVDDDEDDEDLGEEVLA